MACSRFAFVVFLGLVIIGSAFTAEAPGLSPAHSPSKSPEHSPTTSPTHSSAVTPSVATPTAATPTVDTPTASSPATVNSGSSPAPSPNQNRAVSNAGFVYGSVAAAVLLSALLM